MDVIGPSAQAHLYWRGALLGEQCLGEHTQGLAALVSPRPRPQEDRYGPGLSGFGVV